MKDAGLAAFTRATRCGGSGRYRRGRLFDFHDMRTWRRNATQIVKQGDVVLPTDDGYDTARAGWNLVADLRPAMVARPMCAEDVREIVAFARGEGLRVVMQGTGHNSTPMGDMEDVVLVRSDGRPTSRRTTATARFHASARSITRTKSRRPFASASARSSRWNARPPSPCGATLASAPRSTTDDGNAGQRCSAPRSINVVIVRKHLAQAPQFSYPLVSQQTCSVSSAT